MKIKTSKKVENELDMLRFKFNFDNNAQLLRLAVNYAIHKNLEIIECSEDGFQIDTLTLFNEDEDFYKYIIKFKYPNSEYRLSLISLMNQGINELMLNLRYAKQDTNEFILKILEETNVSR